MLLIGDWLLVAKILLLCTPNYIGSIKTIISEIFQRLYQIPIFCLKLLCEASVWYDY